MSPLTALSSPAACRCRSLQRGGAPIPERFIFRGARGRECAYQGPICSPWSGRNHLGGSFCVDCCPSCLTKPASADRDFIPCWPLFGRTLRCFGYCQFPCTRGTSRGVDCHLIGHPSRRADCCPVGCCLFFRRCGSDGLCCHRSSSGKGAPPGADRPFVGHRYFLLRTGMAFFFSFAIALVSSRDTLLTLFSSRTWIFRTSLRLIPP
jgi:hypothetical protein